MTTSILLSFLMTIIAALGGLGTLIGVLLRLSARLTAMESANANQDKEIERMLGRMDGMDGIVSEIRIQNARIIERLDNVFSVLKLLEGSRV